VFIILLIACVHVLLYRRKTLRPNYLLLTSAFFMFALNTLILGLSFSRVLDAFVYLGGSMGGPAEFLGMMAQWKEVARTSACSAYIFVADLTLIYRCWIVWSKSFGIIAVPIVIHVVYTAMSCLLNVNMAHLPEGANVFDPGVKSWIVAALAISLGQNVIVTSFIVFKIWSVNSRATEKKLGTLGSTIQIIVESGLIYVVTVLVYLVTYAANSNAQYIMIDILNPVIGITFSLLVVRVAMRRSPRSTNLDEHDSARQGHQASRSVVIAVEQTTHIEGLDSVSDLEVDKQVDDYIRFMDSASTNTAPASDGV